MFSRRCTSEKFVFFVDGQVPDIFVDEIAVANAEIINAISIDRVEGWFSVVQDAKMSKTLLKSCQS